MGYESTANPSDVGDGTAYPITWTNTPDTTGKGKPGSAAASEIVPWELTTAQISYSVSGTATFDILNGSGVLVPVTASFSFTGTINSDFYDGSGTPPDWQTAQEPESDYEAAGQSIAGSATTGDSGTLDDGTPWSISFTMTLAMSGLYAVNGTSFASYVKALTLDLISLNPGDSLLGMIVSTDKNDPGIPGGMSGPLSTNAGTADIFHGSATMYSGATDPSMSIGITAATVTVSKQFTQPADIA